MGHRRLPVLPDTRPWRRTVALLADGASVAEVANATLQAAEKGLEIARGDAGLHRVVWLLAKLVQAARTPDFAASLSAVGIAIPANPDVFDLVSGFSEAVDAQTRQAVRRTDITEMAQMAAVKSLTVLLTQRADGMFGDEFSDTKAAARKLSTKVGVSVLMHDFFSRFLNGFLTYHLGRELSNHVGPNGRFNDPAAHDGFLDNLRTHCREAALILKDYSGGWSSKAQFENGLSPRSATLFTRYALLKLKQEIERRGARHGE